MNNFLILCFCLSSFNLLAQLSVNDEKLQSSLFSAPMLDGPIDNSELVYTKLSTDQCPIENGYGISNCSLQELKQFMATLEYPAIAYEYDIQQKCKISFTSNVEGETNNITVSDCSETLFGEAITDHLTQFKWTPATKNGEAKTMDVTFNMLFQISN